MHKKLNISTDVEPGRGVLSSEKGSVLLTTVLILLLLTIIGVSGINTASTDLQITRNYRIHKENVMLADGSINLVKSLLANGVVDDAPGWGSVTWVSSVEDLWGADAGADLGKYFKNSIDTDTNGTSDAIDMNGNGVYDAGTEPADTNEDGTFDTGPDSDADGIIDPLDPYNDVTETKNPYVLTVNQLDVARIVADWENGIAEINPKAFDATQSTLNESRTEFAAYCLGDATNGMIGVIIARSRKNDGDVVIEAAFDNF